MSKDRSGAVQRRHGRYLIRAALLGGRPTARAFLAEAKQGSGIVAERTGDTLDAAIDALVADLDARSRERRQGRRRIAEPDMSVPTREEYAEALSAVRLTDGQWAMLRAHAMAGECGMTAGELARAAGWRNLGSANMQYGLAGRAIADYLGIDLPPRRTAPAEEVATRALAGAGVARPDGSFVWVMHPELAAAVREAT